jgi:hypothetical protein
VLRALGHLHSQGGYKGIDKERRKGVMDWSGDIGVVMGAISTIVCAWFGYNQYAKNKEIDLKMAKREQEDKEKRNAEKRAASAIFRELWPLLSKFDGVLRVYIVQPHPLDRAKYVSVMYEVVSEGMVNISPIVRRMPIGNIMDFVGELEGKDFVYWASQSAVKAGRARSIMHQLGTDKMVAVRMMSDGLWQGNVVIDFDDVEIDIEAVKSALYDVRSNIQYILPEIED